MVCSFSRLRHEWLNSWCQNSNRQSKSWNTGIVCNRSVFACSPFYTGVTCLFILLQNHWFTYNETMTVESVTQAVSNLALQFGEEDADPGAMVSHLLSVNNISTPETTTTSSIDFCFSFYVGITCFVFLFSFFYFYFVLLLIIESTIWCCTSVWWSWWERPPVVSIRLTLYSFYFVF